MFKDNKGPINIQRWDAGSPQTVTVKQLKKLMPANIRVKMAIEDKTVEDLIIVVIEQQEWYKEFKSCVLSLAASNEDSDMWKFLGSHFNHFKHELKPKL